MQEFLRKLLRPAPAAETINGQALSDGGWGKVEEVWNRRWY